MDLQKALRELLLQKQRLDGAIAELEGLQKAHSGGGGSVKKGRGRKSMSPQERQEVSERMKRFWAKKRQRQPK